MDDPATPPDSGLGLTERPPEAVVQMTGIGVEFPGVRALHDVDLTLYAGEVHALLGENGAGKSTLIKALTGVRPPDAGEIRVAGRPVAIHGPAQAQDLGISTVYQEVNLCPNLTVAENIMLGREPRRAGGIDWRGMRRQAAEVLGRLNVDIDPASPLSAHSIAVQQLVAIARAMQVDARVLILDEPTSSLDADEVAELFRVMRGLREDGVAILFVTHFLEQVDEIADRITVLRNGARVGERRTGEMTRIELVSMMIGRELAVLEDIAQDTEARDESAAPAGADTAPTPFLRAIGLGRRGSIEAFDLDVYPGEVVGLAGLLGSGRSEMARLLYGADHADTGTLEVDGAPARLRNPRAAIAERIAFSSENRKAEGLVEDLTVRENIVLGLQAARGWARRVPQRTQDELTSHYIEALGIRPANPEALVRNLSGGNQQKVLLARWLATAPRLLILDEPPRGIDVGAKAEIQKLVHDLATQGMSVVFISAELDEVLRLSHRIAVLRDRRKVAEIANGPDVTARDVLELIASGGQE
ncbi:sugar ABC transporter ATP-binding protein [Cellulomonas timonensis]|uniref:sugar ABC transporter ATP-binding protein n=1 Tax=Cellulomonas timonensis TaxID=1689271 RepID=UPI0009EE7F37|nr:sugar ABC transporter ATP-binding protein [Cellulomonas timonensis]